MIKNEYKLIGVMSGTSLDGVDLIYVTLFFDPEWHYKIHHAETVNYNEKWNGILQNLVSFTKEELHKIDKDYTLYLSGIVTEFIKSHDIIDIDAICSHGHTALHQPKDMFTYQIGNLPILAKLLGQTVVCDFRVQDVELGGQGAPLVPIGDRLLFSQYEYCLNLGGFANISTEFEDQRIAFDICPINVVLNHYVRKIGFSFDDKGSIAATGKINSKLLTELNALEFYQSMYPKSLGLEWVVHRIFPLIDSYGLDIKDTLRTFTEHIAVQIGAAIQKNDKAQVLITGGGAYNTFLINRIDALTPNPLVLPDDDIINYKEVLIFALLGVLKLRNEVNCLCSVTGAKHDHSSGRIFHP